jgi:hypothetical protein
MRVMLKSLVAAALVATACGDSVPDEEVAPDDGAAPKVMVEAPEAVTMVEGETSTFLVKLSAEPNLPITIEIRSRDESVVTAATRWIFLTRANYASGVPVELGGEEDDGDVINDSVDVDLLIRGDLTQRVVATVMDNDVQQIVTDRTSLSINEGYIQSFTVRLAREPSASATLNVTSTTPSLATPSPAILTFTRQNYAVPQRVDVLANRDNDTLDGTANITVGDLPGVQSPTVTAHVHDVDVQKLLLSANNLGIYEGSGATFTVALAYDPLGPVSISVASNKPTVVAITSSTLLTFNSSNYAVPNAVSVATFEDSDKADDGAIVTLSGPPSDAVNVAVWDNDEIIVPAQITVNEGGTTSLLVQLANDPGTGGRVVDVQVVSGDASIADGTLNFSSYTYATGMAVTVTGLSDPYSRESKSAVLRVSSPGQISRDVQVTVLNQIPGHLTGFLTEHWDSAAGAVGELEMSLNLPHAWPGDGVLEVSFPAIYDLSGVSIEGASVDGSLSLAINSSQLVIKRTGGTASSTSVTIRFANWRNPGVSGSYWIPAETRTAAAVPIDKGELLDTIGSAVVIGGTVSLSSQQPGTATNATFIFTTKNAWPSDGLVSFYLPPDFDVSNATVITATSGFDGVLTFASTFSYPTFARSGGTTVPAGSTISITLGNVMNPATARETSSFSVETAAASYATIDRATMGGVIIGCPPIRRNPMRVASLPFGVRPWNWTSGMQVQWGYPAIATMVGETELLVLDDFRFVLPSGATISGIELEVRHDVQTDQIVDSAVQIVKGGVVGSVDHSSSAPWVWWTEATYGGSNDLWGETWMPADIFGTAFGVAIAAKSVASVTATAGIGQVTLTVYSTCP